MSSNDEPGSTARRNMLIAMAIGLLVALALVGVFYAKVAGPAANQRPSAPPIGTQG